MALDGYHAKADEFSSSFSLDSTIILPYFAKFLAQHLSHFSNAYPLEHQLRVELSSELHSKEEELKIVNTPLDWCSHGTNFACSLTRWTRWSIQTRRPGLPSCIRTSSAHCLNSRSVPIPDLNAHCSFCFHGAQHSAAHTLTHDTHQCTEEDSMD
jgi:hypothetical protein